MNLFSHKLRIINMKYIQKNSSAFLIISGLSLFVEMSAAAPMNFSDVDVFNQSMAAGSPSSSYSGTFQFVTPDAGSNMFTATGFGPADGTYMSNFGFVIGTPVIDGSITFFFRDPDGGEETGSVTANFISASELSSFTTYSVFSHGLEFNILSSISPTGFLTYTVSTTSGSFDLVAGIGSITTAVPDGGDTLVMMGGGLLGLVALKRGRCRNAA